MWNSVIRYVLQAYLKISITCMLAIFLIDFKNSKATINAIVCILLLTFISIIPFIFMRILYKKRKTLHKSRVRKKLGSLYLGIKTKNSIEYSYSMVFLIRRMIYAILTATCLNNPNICIHIFLFSNIMYLVYFNYARSHDTNISRRIELMNEVCLQLVTYHLALFPLALTLDDEEMFGWSMIGFIFANFFLNLSIILMITLSAIKRKLYLRGLKNKFEKRKNEL